MLLAKFKYYSGSFRKKGVIETLKQALSDYYYNKKLAKYNFHFSPAAEHASMQASEEVLTKSIGKDGTVDSPTSSYYVFKYFRAIKLEPEQIHLLDIGCGSGKVLATGMILNFGKVTGVDLDSDSLARAQENCRKASAFHTNTKWELTNCDATRYVIAHDVNVIFLANPFYEITMKSVVNNIVESYEKSKRSVYVIYHCPLYAHLFDESKAFKRYYTGNLKEGMPEVIIYKTGT